MRYLMIIFWVFVTERFRFRTEIKGKGKSRGLLVRGVIGNPGGLGALRLLAGVPVGLLLADVLLRRCVRHRGKEREKRNRIQIKYPEQASCNLFTSGWSRSKPEIVNPA